MPHRIATTRWLRHRNDADFILSTPYRTEALAGGALTPDYTARAKWPRVNSPFSNARGTAMSGEAPLDTRSNASR